MSRDTDVAFFLQDLDGGGAERAIIALAGEIAERGYAVDLVVGEADSDYRSEVCPEVRVEDFATRSRALILLRLIAYLRRSNPAAMMSALDISNVMLVAAARLTGYKGRTVVSQRAVVAASLRELAPSRRMVLGFLQRVCFPRADAVISNSHAGARDVRTSLRVLPERVFTIHNALDADRIGRLAGEPLGAHSFLEDGAPLIVSVGSLSKRKDLGTLIRAVARVRTRQRAHLVIVGKGPEAAAIQSLAADLQLGDCVHLLGFDANPYKWMAAARVVVSSSTAEGFPNAIAEALALGRPVVATDCPGDTAELLQQGKWGRLVPVGNPESMAAEILAALEDPNPPDGRIRARDFTPSKVTGAYLDVLLPRLSLATGAVGRSP